jgi:mRNA-degrading endonuclease RelE of RelBE toxin-antitoxin system
VRYSVDITATAEKEMDKLPRHVHRRITEKILLLEEDPRPPGAKHLEAPFEGYRLRT